MKKKLKNQRETFSKCFENCPVLASEIQTPNEKERIHLDRDKSLQGVRIHQLSCFKYLIKAKFNSACVLLLSFNLIFY